MPSNRTTAHNVQFENEAVSSSESSKVYTISHMYNYTNRSSQIINCSYPPRTRKDLGFCTGPTTGARDEPVPVPAKHRTRTGTGTGSPRCGTCLPLATAVPQPRLFCTVLKEVHCHKGSMSRFSKTWPESAVEHGLLTVTLFNGNLVPPCAKSTCQPTLVQY